MKIMEESVHTYPEMNETIKQLLRLSEEPMHRYILARLEELETQLAAASLTKEGTT